MSSEPPSNFLSQLEELSRQRPDRVLRLRGRIDGEPLELLIFRGFSCSTTHPTAFDPDQSVLPPGAGLEAAELLAGPLDPAAETLLAGPQPPETFLEPQTWL
ncbi:hypothetical protein [Cyanobium sp. NIES-981]|uniref:DUF7734 family protein n=1 Tax=Cyanobium sp. NIES-981 TaxID=1851505 RepID=UPI0007DD773A|nr:hypothetical protein [Cyanobium sp. NIES-981]SBO43642.1 conserved protein of unknown function [Cyanobium sp. NIES-981]